MKSIFTRPIFINPQAYLTIPELSLIHKCIPFDFTSNEYLFQVITTGRIEGKILESGTEYILHLDMYTKDGACVLGEFYIQSNTINPQQFDLKQDNGFVTIKFSNPPIKQKSPIKR